MYGNEKTIARRSLWFVGAMVLLTAILPGAALAGVTPLAVVDGDTITTEDLSRELAIMRKLKDFDGEIELPSGSDALQRMIQNRLVVQEGYRLGLHNDFAVQNQVEETIRLRMVASMLDSVAAQIPAGPEGWLERRRAVVDGYVKDLMKQYDVVVDSTLLRSLDYASSDPAMKKRLQQSEEVLAVLPSGSLRVRSLSMEVRFKEFHGLTGRADAAEVRDAIFYEWLMQGLLTWEGRKQKLHESPDLVAYARELEENWVSEEALKTFLRTEFRPAEDQVQKFYEAHLDAVTPEPRVKMESVLISDGEAAGTFRQRLLDGAKLTWLKKVTKEVVAGPPPFPADWFEPQKLGLTPEEIRVGAVPEPYEVPGGAFAVAIVSDVERPEPMPLAECRETILQLMRRDHVQNVMKENFRLLEEAAEIQIMPGAVELVERYLSQITFETEES